MLAVQDELEPVDPVDSQATGERPEVVDFGILDARRIAENEFMLGRHIESFRANGLPKE